MKRSLPANAKISKEAKETVQECVSEFISFVTGEASDKCQREKRKTINGDDLLWAMTTLGFENYVGPLKTYLNRYRETEGEKNGAVAWQGDQSPAEDGGCGSGSSGGGRMNPDFNHAVGSSDHVAMMVSGFNGAGFYATGPAPVAGSNPSVGVYHEMGRVQNGGGDQGSNTIRGIQWQ
ncbi:nuclear transcription factor Y subunit B-3-like [Ananas comosus]|nr:nuclear transcription factor Y subunit B-3-like [Ananas comosus]